MWYKDVEQPYDFQSSYTENTYEYLIKDIFDKDEEIKGYRKYKGNPSNTGRMGIASEVYSFFGTHYHKIVQTIINIEQNNREILHNNITLIDVGANIGTATFAYLDLLSIKQKSTNINVKIIFIEPDINRTEFLKKTIEKYIELSGFNITFNIIQDKFETSKECIINELEKDSTVILVSNVLNWPEDINIFKEELLDIIKLNDLATYIVNIESQYEKAKDRLIKIYDSLNFSKLDIERNCAGIPKFRNPKLNYFRDRFNNDIYKSKGKFYYGYIIKHPIVVDTTSVDTIRKAYYKSIYTIENYFIHDGIELKYINRNIDNVTKYISKIIEEDIKVNSYRHQYYIKKSVSKYRSMYIDDMLNDIIYASILITKGIYLDGYQSNEVSFGNRIDEDSNSPFIFKPYYSQYFEKFMKKYDEYSSKYNNYYKIDLKSYYNNIDHSLLNQKINNYNFECNWYVNMINSYIEHEKLLLCENKKGIAQGPDFSNLLGNIYLQQFDDWFVNNFEDANLIRYVDDITIFSDSEERCLEIKKECCNYLEKELLVCINDDKDEYGSTNVKDEKADNNYFQQISNNSNDILRSLYQLDSKNHSYYKRDTSNFFKIYQICLSRIGISVSLEWLRIKLEKEESFIDKIKSTIKDRIKRDSWLKDKVYKFNVDLGTIPLELDNKKIDIWEKEFRRKRKNREILNRIQSTRQELELKMENIITEAKLETGNNNLNKSLFKFTFKKMSTFKSDKLIMWIEDIFRYFPQCNKKMLWSYKEIENLIAKLLLKENDIEKYDMYIYIWLLGEYKSIKNLDIIEDIFINSYKNKYIFLNSISAEAILKIGQCTSEFIINIKEALTDINEYYLIRNILLILHKYDIECFNEMLIKLNKEEYDERTNMFIDWIYSNIDIQLIEEIGMLPEEIIDEYRDYYPMEETYSGYKSL
ncbi:RNA-directed DNA polymerase [[Clostridium] sordellii]|uniref:RNA-directed DNA polymerase n=1 Tax=Paraclostridium sordellii TaxID=1505 RepID=UPI0005E93476|nr:RNA-directed DNA polymerase [Paeniclostridium sordellii]CEQ29996.1 RNA-directed DNA polymerase [[Clostridium] sordellii] [Paeniclostridium sordellii]